MPMTDARNRKRKTPESRLDEREDDENLQENLESHLNNTIGVDQTVLLKAKIAAEEINKQLIVKEVAEALYRQWQVQQVAARSANSEIKKVKPDDSKMKPATTDDKPDNSDEKSDDSKMKPATTDDKPDNSDEKPDDSEMKTEKVQPKTLTEKYIRMCHHIAELLLALMVTSISSIGKFFADTWLRGWLSEQTRSNIPHIFHLRVFWGPRMMFNGWDKKTFTKLCWIVVAALALVCFHSNLSQRVCIHRTCYSDTNFNMVTKKVDTVVSMQKQDIPLGASKILQQAYLSLLVSNAVLLFSLRAGGVLITAWALCYGLIFSFFLSELNDKDCSNVELSRILFHMANPPVDPRVNLCSQQ